jgi:hypothetical protein
VTCAKVCGTPADVGYQTCMLNCEAYCTCQNTPKPLPVCAYEICTDGSWKQFGGQPKGTSCVASGGKAGDCNGSTTAPACIPNAPSYSVGGSVSGLTSGGCNATATPVTLILNNGATVTSSGGSFTFPATLFNDDTYNISVAIQPSGQTCTVSDGSGKINGANVSNVSVSCTVPPDIPVCDKYGCLSEAKFVANICSGLQSALGQNAVGYVFAVGALPPVYAGLARTAQDPPKTPMSPYPMTDVASVSKTLTAIGVLQVLTKFGLTIDTPISKYIYSDWQPPGANVGNITFGDLLTHHVQWNNDCGNSNQYAELKTLILAGAVKIAANVYGTTAGNSYGNCNFALFRELLPSIFARPYLDGLADGPTRAAASAGLFIGYMDQYVFQPVGDPISGGGQTQCSPPAPGPLAMLSYPLPAGTAKGQDFASFNVPTSGCGARMWELSAADLMKVLNDLANGNVLLTPAEKTQMFTDWLGWDNAVGRDCPGPYLCKNGAEPGPSGVRTYAGIFKGTVPVAVIVNSPLDDTIPLVRNAYCAATANEAQTCNP